MKQVVKTHTINAVSEININEIIKNDKMDLFINGALDVSIQSIAIVQSIYDKNYIATIVYNLDIS